MEFQGILKIFKHWSVEERQDNKLIIYSISDDYMLFSTIIYNIRRLYTNLQDCVELHKTIFIFWWVNATSEDYKQSWTGKITLKFFVKSMFS